MKKNKIRSENISICFTWDDNCEKHKNIIAPLLDKYKIRCTFYINPSDIGFKEIHANNYNLLAKQGFEIGSHGNIHQNMTELSEFLFIKDINLSIAKIIEYTGKRPLTYAFPHHYYNDLQLNIIRKYFIESRNTLINSQRFSLKSSTTLEEMSIALSNSINNNLNLIFSGHSIFSANVFNINNCGYEPVNLNEFEWFLKTLKTFNNKIDILTFSQATYKELLKKSSLKRKKFQFDTGFFDKIEKLRFNYVTI